MNRLISTYQQYVSDNNPTIIYSPGIRDSHLPQDILDILQFDQRTLQKIQILEPDYYAKFVVKDSLNSFELSSDKYMECFDKELFSDYLLNYSKIK